MKASRTRLVYGSLEVGDTGFEPVTSSVQTAEPRYHPVNAAHVWQLVGDTGFEPVTSSV